MRVSIRTNFEYPNYLFHLKFRYILGGLDINYGRFSISRKTIKLLDTRRKSMVEQRKLRKSQLINHNQANAEIRIMGMTNYNTVKWLRDTHPPPQYHLPNAYPKDIHSIQGIDNVGFEKSTTDSAKENLPRQSRVTFI